MSLKNLVNMNACVTPELKEEIDVSAKKINVPTQRLLRYLLVRGLSVHQQGMKGFPTAELWKVRMNDDALITGSLDGVDREKLKKAIEETEAILHSTEEQA